MLSKQLVNALNNAEDLASGQKTLTTLEAIQIAQELNSLGQIVRRLLDVLAELDEKGGFK